MADDASSHIIATWPPEGTTLSETYERAPAWPELVIARENAQREPAQKHHWISVWSLRLAECEQWVREHLQNGALVLVVYRSENQVILPPPLAHHLVFDTTNEIIRIPKGETFYGPRIYSAATSPKGKLQLDEITRPTGVSLDATKIALKKLLEDIIEEVPFPAPGDRQHGWKKKWAKEVTVVINERHRQEPTKVRRTTPRSIENRMNEFSLWPE
jgi:hypothetical protein